MVLWACDPFGTTRVCRLFTGRRPLRADFGSLAEATVGADPPRRILARGVADGQRVLQWRFVGVDRRSDRSRFRRCRPARLGPGLTARALHDTQFGCPESHGPARGKMAGRDRLSAARHQRLLRRRRPQRRGGAERQAAPEAGQPLEPRHHLRAQRPLQPSAQCAVLRELRRGLPGHAAIEPVLRLSD